MTMIDSEKLIERLNELLNINDDAQVIINLASSDAVYEYAIKSVIIEALTMRNLENERHGK